jgi:hypothetical protein
MNKNIKLAVAGAVLALSATANAGIIIPAGEWTIDINGNVNAFLNQTNLDNNRATTGSQLDQALVGGKSATKSIQTGLLPAWLGFTGKTRQYLFLNGMPLDTVFDWFPRSDVFSQLKYV